MSPKGEPPSPQGPWPSFYQKPLRLGLTLNPTSESALGGGRLQGGRLSPCWPQLMCCNSTFHQGFSCPRGGAAHMDDTITEPLLSISVMQGQSIKAVLRLLGGDGENLQSLLPTSSSTATSSHFLGPQTSAPCLSYTPNEDKLLLLCDYPRLCVVILLSVPGIHLFLLCLWSLKDGFWQQDPACSLIPYLRTRKYNHKVQGKCDAVQLPGLGMNLP